MTGATQDVRTQLRHLDRDLFRERGLLWTIFADRIKPAAGRVFRSGSRWGVYMAGTQQIMPRTYQTRSDAIIVATQQAERSERECRWRIEVTEKEIARLTGKDGTP